MAGYLKLPIFGRSSFAGIRMCSGLLIESERGNLLIFLVVHKVLGHEPDKSIKLIFLQIAHDPKQLWSLLEVRNE